MEIVKMARMGTMMERKAIPRRIKTNDHKTQKDIPMSRKTTAAVTPMAVGKCEYTCLL
jgi:hypothetical protein